MVRLPQGWRVHVNRDRGAEVGCDLQAEMARRRQRHTAIARGRRHRRRLLDRLRPLAGGVALAAVFVAVPLAWEIADSPWGPLVTVRHLAAGLNCAAARAVGLGPARRGEPGYWSSHDADRDGIACERWPRW